MKVLKATIWDKQENYFTKIELPASFEEMEEAFHKIHSTPQDSQAMIYHFIDKPCLLSKKEILPCSLYELNHFANVISGMSNEDYKHLNGLLEISHTSNKVSVADLINTALNLDEGNTMWLPITTDKELGEFYVDFELVPELENLPKDNKDWLLNHIDCEKVGKEIREAEHGIYCGKGYTVLYGELKQLYDGNFIVPKAKDYVFQLKISKAGDTPNDEHTVTLTLPASHHNILSAIKQTGANTIDECIFNEFKSTIPQLEKTFKGFDELDMLNELAGRIEEMKQFEDIAKYKAMLELLEVKTLQTAYEVTTYMSHFDMLYDCYSPSDYAIKSLEHIDLPMKEILINNLSKDGYGTALMQKSGVEQTAYGMLVPFSGIKLSEQMENGNTNMEMEIK